jgi:hypothetical protein
LVEVSTTGSTSTSSMDGDGVVSAGFGSEPRSSRG